MNLFWFNETNLRFFFRKGTRAQIRKRLSSPGILKRLQVRPQLGTSPTFGSLASRCAVWSVSSRIVSLLKVFTTRPLATASPLLRASPYTDIYRRTQCFGLFRIRLLIDAELVFVNLLRSPGIDYQLGGIDSWAPLTFLNTDSDLEPGLFKNENRKM
jgi:hypothetical protein